MGNLSAEMNISGQYSLTDITHKLGILHEWIKENYCNVLTDSSIRGTYWRGAQNRKKNETLTSHGISK